MLIGGGLVVGRRKLDLGNMPDATIVAHYRADDYTAGDWPDRTANGYDLAQGTSANQPSAIADGGSDFNSQPIVRFDGNDYLTRASTPSQSQPFTLIAISKCTSDDGSEDQIISNLAANNPYVIYSASELVNIFAGSGSLVATSSGLNTAQLIEGYFDDSSSDLLIDGTSEDSGSIGTGSISGLSVGRRQNGSAYLIGDIAELLLIDGALTTADRDYLERYCAQRYGFSF